ncbi:MAG: GNAT family N-acetyltransferase [Phycisphaeraceae bacterium]|nr:GNAT family N-acetyltransferase [Phycisphaeraceae bacterium]
MSTTQPPSNPDTARRSAADPRARYVIRPVEPGRRRRMLGLLLTGKARGGEMAADQFIALAASEPWATDELWAAWRGDEPAAVVLLVPCVGRTAVVFISPAGSADYPDAAGQLLDAVCGRQPPERFSILQTLAEPHQSAEIQVFASAGFEPLAHLVYMERAGGSDDLAALGSVRRPEVAVRTVDPSFTLSRFRPELEGDFARGIERSYEGTLDCPRLLGLRTTDDVIAGHRAVGQFDPDLWWCIHAHGRAEGVVLLNPHPARSCLELVYLGLGPHLRGKRLGRLLMRHALAQAHRRGLGLVQLAVDELNTPAMKLYQELGFQSVSRRLAMIRALNHAANPPSTNTGNG